MATNMLLAQETPRRAFYIVDDEVFHVARYKDTLSFDRQNNEIIRRYRTKGHWLAVIDSAYSLGDSIISEIHLGRRFSNCQVRIWTSDSTSQVFGSRVGRGKGLSLGDYLHRKIESQLSLYENNGYPFASLDMLDAKVFGGSVLVDVGLNPRTHIAFDSLCISPASIVNANFLAAYLRIRKDQPYSEHTVRNVPLVLKDLSFMRLEALDVSYRHKHAYLDLKVTKRSVNRFDGVLGMVPRETDEGVDFTGQLDLGLRNLLRTGKELDLQWQKLRPESQKLDLTYFHPVFFYTPIDLRFGLFLLKQDSLFSNRSLQFALEHRLSPSIRMALTYESAWGAALQDRQDSIGNYTIDYYGTSLVYKTLDDNLYPRQGLIIKLTGQVGNKEISEEGLVVPRSSQYKVQVNLSNYQPLNSRTVLVMGLSAGWLDNQYLYINDLFRLGGLRSIRGFNEGEFFASKFAVSNLEWRLYFEEQSFLVLFVDQAMMSYNLPSVQFIDYPSSIGGGLEISTDGGNFRILYGMGRREEERFSLSQFKIHFGYSALF